MLCATATDGHGCVVGMTPIFRAAAAGEVGVLRYLLDHGGDPAMPDAMRFTPLHIAAENGASLPLMDGYGSLACLCVLVSEYLCDAAAHSGRYEAAALLLSRGVDADPLNSRLVTPLHVAAGKGHDQTLKLLLEHGADVSSLLLRVL